MLETENQLVIPTRLLKWGAVLVFLVAAGGFALGRYTPAFVESAQAFSNVIVESGILQYPGTRGVAWGDYDNDGDLDLLIVGTRNMLYRNEGKEVFTEVGQESGIRDLSMASSSVFADYDNDGCIDLYLANAARLGQGTIDILYKNNCDGTFTDVSESAGILAAYNTYGIAWGDYNRDGYLDLYVANHGGFGEKIVIYEPNILWHNNGDGTFSEVTSKAGVLGDPDCPNIVLSSDNQLARIPVGGPFKYSFQPVWFDYNNDDWPDLFVATDNNASPLFRNNGDGTFTDVTLKAGLCRMGTGMGIAVGDYDNDGDPDFYVTNDGPNYLWHNNGDGTFSEVAHFAGVKDENSIGWGTEFFDYDNDGDLDLYVANGRVDEREVVLMLDKLYRNDGEGKFTQVAASEGIGGNYAKEGSALADYNDDGFVDIFTTPSPSISGKHYKLYRNRGNENNWLKIRLIGKESNRDGVGAKVRVFTKDGVQIREAISGSSYLSQSASWQVFGLGSASLVEAVVVRWPSGKQQVLWNLGVNQTVVVKED